MAKLHLAIVLLVAVGYVAGDDVEPIEIGVAKGGGGISAVHSKLSKSHHQLVAAKRLTARAEASTKAFSHSVRHTGKKLAKIAKKTTGGKVSGGGHRHGVQKLAPHSAPGGQNSHCGKGHGKVAHYFMRSTSRTKEGGKTKRGKKKMIINTMKTKISFKVTDVATGCIAKQLAGRYHQVVHRGGLFPQKSKKFHMMAHWLRMVEVTGYQSGMKRTDTSGKRLAGGKMVPKSVADAQIKALNCKMGFLQSKDGHVLSIFHAKSSKAGCRKIKTQMAEQFESYYFQNGLKQYTTMGQDNGKPARQLVTVNASGGELFKVCRKTAPGSKSVRIGPGGHKGKARGLKVGKGYSMCCNSYNKHGTMTRSSCYFKQRPGRGGMSSLTKNRPTPKWKKKLKQSTKTLPKHHRAMKPGSHGVHHSEEEEDEIKENLADTYDADFDMEHMLLLEEGEGSQEATGKMSGERSGGYPGKGKSMRGQPAVKSNGDQYVKLVREEETKTLRKFSSAEDAHRVLKDAFGEEVERGELGENNHSNKGGWADISPVEQWEYNEAAQSLNDSPESMNTFHKLVGMYQRDGRAVKTVMNHLVDHRHSMTPEALKTAVHALQAASDHEAAQSALVRLLGVPGFETLAAETVHSIDEPSHKMVQGLEFNAFKGGERSETSEAQCSSALALGSAVSNTKDRSESKRIAARLAKAALNSKADSCFVRALGNAAPALGEGQASQVMKASTDPALDDERRATLMASLTYMPDDKIDNFLAAQFNTEKKKEMKLLVAKTLSERKGGASTEKAITTLASDVKKMPEHDDFTMAVKGVFNSRIRAFHSPASMRLLLGHRELGEGKGFSNGRHLNPKLSLSRCSLFEGKKGKLSCERGLVKCVSVKGKKIGCIGAAAYAFMDYGYSYMKANARGAAGFELEFFKWSIKFFDSDNKANLSGASGNVDAYAKYFDVKKRKHVTLYSYKKSANYNTDGNACKANQQTKWSKTKDIKKTFFKYEVCYGIPKIASVCGAAIFSGSIGFRYGIGMIAPAHSAILMNLRPQAGLIITLEVSGQCAGFKGYISGSLTAAEAKVPASAIFEFKHTKQGGVYLGWNVNFLKISLKAGIKGPGLKKCEENTRLGMPSGASQRKLLSMPEELGPSALGGKHRRLGERAQFLKVIAKFAKKTYKKAKKVVKKVAKAVKKLCRIPCLACTDWWGPKNLLTLPGKTLGGTILEKNVKAGSHCSGKAAPGGLNGSAITSATAKSALSHDHSKSKKVSFGRRRKSSARRRKSYFSRHSSKIAKATARATKAGKKAHASFTKSKAHATAHLAKAKAAKAHAAAHLAKAKAVAAHAKSISVFGRRRKKFSFGARRRAAKKKSSKKKSSKKKSSKKKFSFGARRRAAKKKSSKAPKRASKRRAPKRASSRSSSRRRARRASSRRRRRQSLELQLSDSQVYA